MRLFSPRIVKDADFRKAFDEQVCMIAYSGERTRGRPRNTVLGPCVHRQIDLNLGVDIARALMAQMQEKGRDLEPALRAKIIETTGCRLWVGKQLSRLARFNVNVTDENAVEAFAKAAGSLMVIGRRKPGLNIYIATAGAPPAWIRSFYDVARAKGAAEGRRSDRRLRLIERYLEVADRTGLTVEENYEQFCERFELPAAAE